MITEGFARVLSRKLIMSALRNVLLVRQLHNHLVESIILSSAKVSGRAYLSGIYVIN